MLTNVQWSQYKAVSCLSFFMALTTATKYCQNTTGVIIVKKQGKVGQHHRPQEGDVWRGYTPSHWERNFSCIFNHHRHNNEWGPCQPPEAQILDKQRGLHSSKKGSIQWSLTCQLTHCFYAESANQCNNVYHTCGRWMPTRLIGLSHEALPRVWLRQLVHYHHHFLQTDAQP